MLRPQRGERADATSHKTQAYESGASRRVSHLWLCASFRKGVEDGKVCPPVRDDSTIVALFRRNFTTLAHRPRPGRRNPTAGLYRLAGRKRLRGSVNRRVAYVSRHSGKAVELLCELSSIKSCQPIDGSS